MSSYHNYLRKLDTVVTSFEKEWEQQKGEMIEKITLLGNERNWFEGEKTYFESEKNRLEYEKNSYEDKIKSLLNDKYNYSQEKSALIYSYNKKIKSFEDEKSNLIDNCNERINSLKEKENKVIENYNQKIKSLEDAKGKAIDDIQSSAVLTAFIVIIITFIAFWVLTKSFWGGLGLGVIGVGVIFGILYSIFSWIKNWNK